jgi:ubiquinone/menaquinone biosynthesis C-methylase UbiE
VSEDAYISVLVPSLFAPWAELLADALDPAPGTTAVDVATGPGTVARVLARRLGVIGRVYACDLSAAMLSAAVEFRHESGAAPIEYLACPADELPLPDASVDAVTCQHGLQFFPDQVGALAEMRRVARPGAQLVAAVWREIETVPVYAALAAAAEEVLGYSGGFATPFALADAARLRTLAQDAGWQEVAISPRDLPVEFADVTQALRIYEVTPLAETVTALSDPEREELAAAARARLAPMVDADGAVRTTTGANFVIARA